MPNTPQGYQLAGSSYELAGSVGTFQNNAEEVLVLQNFNEAIQPLKDYQNNLAEAQEQYQIEVERKFGRFKLVGVPRELPSVVELIDALEKLKDKVAEDVKEEEFSIGEALKIARSANALTLVLTDPRNNLDIDKKHQAIQKFQDVAEACPITTSKTRLALSMLVGAVVGAAVTFLLVFAPYLILGVALLPLLKCGVGITMLSAGGMIGMALGQIASYRNQEVDNFVSKTEKFVSKQSVVRGLFFSSSSKEKGPAVQQQARSSIENEQEVWWSKLQPQQG
jgi:hypothetical protein